MQLRVRVRSEAFDQLLLGLSGVVIFALERHDEEIELLFRQDCFSLLCILSQQWPQERLAGFRRR